MNILSSLKVLIGAESDDFNKALTQTEQQASAWAGKVSAIVGGVSFATVGAGVIAAAAKFDEAGARIQRMTGAIGDKLKGLETSFGNVYKSTSASAEQVSTALSIIASRSQLTGGALEQTTLSMVKLAKTMGEDVGGLAPLVTRVFGDWSIAADRQARAMAYMQVTAQQTGTTVATLAERVVYAGAPLRALGYDFESAATLIGKFEKEGVNTELVLGAMKAILGKFAKEGIQDTSKAWRDFIDQVKAGNVTLSDIAQTAGEFGVGRRAAVDLFRAVMEGRFEIDKTVDSFKNLAKEGTASVETVRGTLQKWQHQLELVVAQHFQLILIVGTTYPALVGLGSAFAKLGAVALPVITSITTALRFGMVGALGAVETAILSSGILSLFAALGYGGYKLGESLQNKFAPGVDTSRDALENLKRNQFPMPKIPSSIVDYVRNLPATPPATSGAPAPKATVPEYLPETWQHLIDSAGIKEAHAALQQTLKTLYDWQHANEVGMPKVAYAWTDLSNRVLDFNTVAAQSVQVQARIAEVDWSKNVQGIAKTDELMGQLGLTSTHTLRQAYEASLAIEQQIANLYQAGYATMGDLEAAAKHTGEAWKALQNQINGTTDATNKSKNAGVDFGRQVSTVLTDLGRQLADVVFGEKSIGSAFVDVGKAIVRIILEDIIKNAIGKLMSALSGVLSSLGGIGKALGGIFGGVSSGGSSAAASSASSGGAGAGAAAGGASGILGIITGIGSLVTGIIGDIQGAHANTLLGRIEKSTRYTEIYTGEQADSILDTLHIMRDSLTSLVQSMSGMLRISIDGTVSSSEANDLLGGLLTGTQSFYTKLSETCAQLLAVTRAGFNNVVNQLTEANKQPSILQQMLGGLTGGGGILGGITSGAGGILSGIGGAVGGVFGLVGGLISGLFGGGNGDEKHLLLGILNESLNFRADQWNQYNGLLAKLDSIAQYTWLKMDGMWDTMQKGFGGGMAPAVAGSAAVMFNNCTFNGATSQAAVDSMFNEAIRRARAAGSRI